MAKFAYNNAKNASIGHTPFKLNYEYHPQISYKDNVDPYSKFKLADEFSIKLKELIIVDRENLYHVQEF